MLDNLIDPEKALKFGVTVIITAACLLLAIYLGMWGFSEVGGMQCA
jgi:hypothetical protein